MIHDFFRQIKYYQEMQNRQFFTSNTILILLQKLCTIFREATMSRPHKKIQFHKRPPKIHTPWKIEEFEHELNFTITDNEDDDGDEKYEDSVDTFVTSNSRAAQLEAENRDIRIKVASLSTLLQEFCSRTKNLPEKSSSDENNQQTESFNLAEAVTQLENSLILIQNTMPQSDSKDTATHSKSFENVQLQVKMELEHERRLRTQMALGRLRRNFEKPNSFYLHPFRI